MTGAPRGHQGPVAIRCPKCGERHERLVHGFERTRPCSAPGAAPPFDWTRSGFQRRQCPTGWWRNPRYLSVCLAVAVRQCSSPFSPTPYVSEQHPAPRVPAPVRAAAPAMPATPTEAETNAASKAAAEAWSHPILLFPFVGTSRPMVRFSADIAETPRRAARFRSITGRKGRHCKGA